MEARCFCRIASCKKKPRSTSTSSRTQQIGPLGSGNWNQEQRSYVPTQQRQASNYCFSFRSCPTKVTQAHGWRFAPACCAAWSVFRRGPGCAMPLYRVAWEALNFHRHSELHQSSASAGSMKTVYVSLSIVVIWRRASKVVRPNPSLKRNTKSGPSYSASLLNFRPARFWHPLISNVRQHQIRTCAICISCDTVDPCLKSDKH